MIVISVLAVVSAASLPSLSAIFERNRITTQTNTLFSSLVFARSQAVSRNQNVVMCKSVNGTSCTVSGNWESGWLVYIDENSSGIQEGTERVVFALPGLKTGFTLRAGTAYQNTVIFLPDGTVNTTDTFKLCATDGNIENGRSIIISATGRPRSLEGVDQCTS